jgi:hypothetical protein
MPMVSISEYMEGDVKSLSPFIITGVLKPRYAEDKVDLSKSGRGWRRNSRSRIMFMTSAAPTMAHRKTNSNRENCW